MFGNVGWFKSRKVTSYYEELTFVFQQAEEKSPELLELPNQLKYLKEASQ